VAELEWLGVLRHGESVGNIAADVAEAAGADVIDIDLPDMDVPLSDLGERQATLVGGWLAGMRAPTVVLASPYRRALHTAQLVAAALPGPPPVRVDERLRDRELGVLDRLTSVGVAARLPDEAARRRFVGKFLYRPPGGESWADVALRLRSLLTDLPNGYPQGRALLVSHEAVVLLLRYLIEELTIPQLLELAVNPLANGSLTSWQPVDGRLRLATFDDDTALRQATADSRQQHV
jgi:2,3-bisphosphoglycerate-dependent phosphoglycerate mutase